MDDWAAWPALLGDTSTGAAGQPERIAALCVRTLGVTGAGISMVTMKGNRGVVCATDDIAAQIEDLQFTLGEGPSVDAVDSGAPVLIDDLDEPGDIVVERWPAFMNAAADTKMKAVFAFPLRIGVISVGAIDLYRDRSGVMTKDQVTAGLLAADFAAVALLGLDFELADQFAGGLDNRSTYQLQVHQATGMVQVQLGVTTEDAFLMLRARAFATGRRLADIATDVVARRIRFSAEDQ